MKSQVFFPILSVILVNFILSGCIIPVRKPDYASALKVLKTAYPQKYRYVIDVHGDINSEGAGIGLESAAESVGHQINKGKCPTDCNLHVTVSHFERKNGISAATFVVSAFSMLLLPAIMPDNEISVTFQYMLPNNRAFIRSYPMTQYVWGTGFMALFNRWMDKQKTKEIVRIISLQFLSDYEEAEQAGRVSSVFESVRLADNRTFYFASLTEKGPDTIIGLPDGHSFTVPSQSIIEKHLLKEPAQLINRSRYF